MRTQIPASDFVEMYLSLPRYHNYVGKEVKTAYSVNEPLVDASNHLPPSINPPHQEISWIFDGRSWQLKYRLEVGGYFDT